MHTLTLPENTQVVEFISDLHLEQSRPATFQIWRQYMQSSVADVIFILGDLFESWVGDDITSAPSPLGDFERQCVQVLANTKAKVYFMHGNRDFLIGEQFAQASHIELLPDPTLLQWKTSTAILTHGDLLCIDDIEYQATRKQVRNPLWQQQALSLPLQHRLIAAQQLREKSRQTQQSHTEDITDANPDEALRWFKDEPAPYMIHGHTHRPADHQVTANHTRIVLTDWELDTLEPTEQRAEMLRWENASTIKRLTLLNIA